MNPIIAEMARLFPDVKLTSAQVRAAERAANPAYVAVSLRGQARDIRQMFDAQVGKGIASDADVVACINLSKAIGGFGNMPLKWLLAPLGHERAFELGKLAVEPDTMAYWNDLYQRHLDRDPDSEGLAWWLATIEREFVRGIK